ncbi:MAG: lytic transglycosylase domain-containing protein [Thermoleophilia bacterium]
MTALTRSRPRVRLRTVVGVLLLALLALGWWQTHQRMPGWYARLWYPLRHENVINEESRRHGLDPALVAAVIDTESGWTPDAVSGAGAVGLMQLLPETARYIASRPDRPSPAPGELTRPEVNIAYGTWYLRYLVDRHDGLAAALAAYNAGERNVGDWEDAAAAQGRRFDADRDIPFPETRSFVHKVLRETAIYRRAYAGELGPPVTGLARRRGSAGALSR